MLLPLGELWRIGTTRCVVTPETSQPPYVQVYDGEALIAQHQFNTHDAAYEDAISQLRASTPANPYAE